MPGVTSQIKKRGRGHGLVKVIHTAHEPIHHGMTKVIGDVEERDVRVFFWLQKASRKPREVSTDCGWRHAPNSNETIAYEELIALLLASFVVAFAAAGSALHAKMLERLER